MTNSRPNPEIPEILRLIESSVPELLAETDHTRRIGRARILMAHLQMLCDEPERIVELVGAEEADEVDQAAHAWLEPGDFTGTVPPFTGARPFDEPGDQVECYVQFIGGVLSPVYTPGPLDPMLTGPMQGFIMHALEVVWVAETATTQVIVDDEVVRREADRHRAGGHWVLVDPAGRGIGVGAVAGRHPTHEAAVERATTLARRWKVRTAVALPRIAFHTR